MTYNTKSQEIGSFFYNDALYHVRGSVDQGGWTGYVLCEGEYVLTLPIVPTAPELITIAEQRIKETRSY